MSFRFWVFTCLPTRLGFWLIGLGGLVFGFRPVLAQVPNTIISTLNTPNEPSIALHPTNPNIIWAGTNHNNIYYSEDGGKTWLHELAISKSGVGGDPVMHINKNGKLFYFHLSNPPKGNWIDRIVVQRRPNLIDNWDVDTYTGLNGNKAQDKHWVAEDANNGNLYLTWTQFDEYGVSDPKKRSNIMFSSSTDEGETWTPAQDISFFDGDCIDNDNTVEGAVPAVDKNGKIHVCWAGPKGLVYQKSSDFGKTWFEKEKIIEEIPGGWVYDIPGIYRCNGLPVTEVDLSNGKFQNSIYVAWSDQRNGETNTDIFIKYSRDGGENWSKTIRVNNDEIKAVQFLSWLKVDPATGYIYLVFYDRRNHYDNKTDVFLAVSKDGGESFENYEISETPFNPNKKVFFGDYTNLAISGDILQAIWTRLDDKQLSLITARISTKNLNIPVGLYAPNSGNFDVLIIQNNKETELISNQYFKKGIINTKTLNLSELDISKPYYLELRYSNNKKFADRIYLNK